MRLIDADELKKNFELYYADNISKEGVVREIEKQPTIGWIPVSERLPEETGTYFVTFDVGDGIKLTDAVNFFADSGRWSCIGIYGWSCIGIYGKITAWLPFRIPEPYEGSETDADE